MPGHPALFLDRDGNLIRDHHHTCREDQIEPIKGVKEALEACLRADYRLFILTNQSGINRGIFTWEAYEACNHKMLKLLNLPAPGILEIKAAPERPDEPSLYRKPSPRFIQEMAVKYSLDLGRSWMIGDRRTDWEAGINAAIHACAVRSGKPLEPVDEVFAHANGVVIHEDFPAFVRQELLLRF